MSYGTRRSSAQSSPESKAGRDMKARSASREDYVGDEMRRFYILAQDEDKE